MQKLTVELRIPSRAAYGPLLPPPPKGLSVGRAGSKAALSAGGYTALVLFLEGAREVGILMLASWLYDVFKNKDPEAKTHELKISEVRYRIETKEQLIEIIEREIKQTDKN